MVVEQDVAWLDVAVADAALVQEGQGLEGLRGPHAHPFFADAARPHPGRQRTAAIDRHAQREPPVRQFDGVVDGDDARMAGGPQDLDLALEARAEAVAVDQVGPHHLERALLPRAGVPAAIDRRHATLAQHGEHLVLPAQDGAGGVDGVRCRQRQQRRRDSLGALHRRVLGAPLEPAAERQCHAGEFDAALDDVAGFIVGEHDQRFLFDAAPHVHALVVGALDVGHDEKRVKVQQRRTIRAHEVQAIFHERRRPAAAQQFWLRLAAAQDLQGALGAAVAQAPFVDDPHQAIAGQPAQLRQGAAGGAGKIPGDLVAAGGGQAAFVGHDVAQFDHRVEGAQAVGRRLQRLPPLPMLLDEGVLTARQRVTQRPQQLHPDAQRRPSLHDPQQHVLDVWRCRSPQVVDGHHAGQGAQQQVAGIGQRIESVG